MPRHCTLHLGCSKRSTVVQHRQGQPQSPSQRPCNSAVTHAYSRAWKHSLHPCPSPSMPQQAENPRTEYVHHTRARHEDFASQSDSRPFAGMDSHRKGLDKGSFFKGDIIWQPARTRHKQQSPKEFMTGMRKAMTLEDQTRV